MTYIRYSSDDTDAPQLTSSKGSLKNILKACLVTGYGSGADEKLPANWEVLFEDTNKIAIRPTAPGGDNRIIRIDDGANAKYAICSIYDDMTDVDTGTKVSPVDFKVYSKSANWVAYANAQEIALVITESSGTSVYVYFGALTKVLVENKNETVLFTTNSLSYPSSMSFLSPLFVNKTQTCAVCAAEKINASTAFFGVTNLTTVDNGEFVYNDIVLFSTTTGRIIGKLPCFKSTTVNYKLPTWHDFGGGVYAMRGDSKNKVQYVLDTNEFPQ